MAKHHKHKTAQKVGKAAYGAAASRAAAPAARPAAAKPAAVVPPPPAQPNRVDPFWNGDDLNAINDFTTKYTTDFANIDFGLGQQQADTVFQTKQTDDQAKAQTGGTQDDMAGRGLFKSSIKDAALYDIEAQRELSNKFLADKMTAATLNSGTQKKILGDSKTRFDQAMLARKQENASAVNDPLSAAWADQMASYNAAHPKPAAAPAAPKPPAAGPATGPAAAVVPGSGQVGAGAAALGRPRAPRTNTARGSGRTSTAAKPYRWPNGSMHTKPYRGN